MLPKQNRLPPASIRTVFKHGKRIAGQYITCLYKKKSTGQPRFAFVVPKKHEKTAVRINTTKRMMRSAVYEIIQESVMPVDMVLISKLPLADMSQTGIKQHIRSLFQSIKVMRV